MQTAEAGEDDVAVIVDDIAGDAVRAAGRGHLRTGQVVGDGEVELGGQFRVDAGDDDGKLVLGLDDDALVHFHRHGGVSIDVLQVIDFLVSFRIAGNQASQDGGRAQSKKYLFHNLQLANKHTKIRFFRKESK